MDTVTPDLARQKAELRLQMKEIRSSMAESEREQYSKKVCENLWRFFEEQREKFISRPIAVYLARPVEVSLDPLITQLLEANFTVVAPRVDLGKNEMNFWRLNSLEQIEHGPWNLREPLMTEILVPQVVLLPGLAFDLNGGRLGMGGGWYDRTLELLESSLKIGVCFEKQVVERVSREAHDLSVDYVVSEARFIESRKSNRLVTEG